MQLRTGIIEQAGSRDATIGERLCVEERLERGARLAQRKHPVNLRGTTQLAGRADPCQHLAARVIQHQHRAILDMPMAQLAQLALQCLHDESLQRRAQRGDNFPCARRIAMFPQPVCLGAPGGMLSDTRARIESLALQRLFHIQIQTVAGRARIRLLHQEQHAAGPSGNLGGPRVRATNERGRHCGLAVVQAVRRLAKERSAQRVDADHFTAKRHQIKVGLENLILAPAHLQPFGGQGLTDLLAQVAPVLPAPQIGIEQAHQLHRDGRSPARLLVP